MATEKITIKANELKNGDRIASIGIYKSAYSGSPAANVNFDEFRDLVKFTLGGNDSSMHLSSDWYLEVIREKEKLAQYYFKNHPMKEEPLVKETSQLWKNASVIIHDGKVLKHPE